MTIRVLVVDDHPIFRSGIVGSLVGFSDLEVVGEASDGAEAQAMAVTLRPDVVLMDLRMGGRDGSGTGGLTATRWITTELPSTRVLILTTYSTDGDILRAVEAGAVGYLLKDAEEDSLINAIRKAATGETVIDPHLASRLVGTMHRRTRPTDREIEVLRLVAEGLTNGEIATHLHISEATVKTHLLRVFAKLDVEDRTRAVMTSIEQGWLTRHDD